MKIDIEVDEKMLRQLVIEYLKDQLGNMPLDSAKVRIETKSKQNYRSEWETAAFRAVYHVET